MFQLSKKILVSISYDLGWLFLVRNLWLEIHDILVLVIDVLPKPLIFGIKIKVWGGQLGDFIF
jgi:hypothetical protein